MEGVAVNDKVTRAGGEVAAVDEASGTVYVLPLSLMPPRRGGGASAADEDAGTAGMSPP